MANALNDTRRISYGSPYDKRDLKVVWQGLKDAYVQGIQAVPEWLAGQMAPEVYTPGVIANTPKERIRANQMWREQDIARRRKELGRDYEQGMDFGNALSVVADPYFDGVLGAIPMLSKALKLSAPRRTGNALQGLVSSEVGAVGDIARLQRAKDQGFNTKETLYHGTGDISDFTSFDSSKTGKGNDQYGSGFYLTTSPREASGYAMDADRGQGVFKSKDKGVLQVYTNMNDYINIDPKTQRNLGDVITLDASQVRKMLDKSKALKRGVDDENMNPAGDHFESFWDNGVEDWMLDDLAETYSKGTPENIEVELFDGDSEAFRRALGEVTGKQGLRVDFGDGLSHVIPWFPENIRSVNAKFDPSKKISKDLLATGALGTIGYNALQDR